MTTITATDLRSNVYRMIDQVLATGEPLIVKRGDQAVEVRPISTRTGSKLDRIVPIRNAIINPELPLESPWDEAAWLKKWDERLG